MRAARYAEGLDQSFVDYVVNELPGLSFATASAFYAVVVPSLTDRQLAFLAANDRFFLLTVVLRRADAIHEWLYDRCREVEEKPDGRIDLWARFHYKSTIITFAGIISEIINNPEITIGLFSITSEISTKFLGQIKEEAETNELLYRLFPDVFWIDRKDAIANAQSWSDKGLSFRREGNPKESTIEAYALLNSPTSRHYDLRVYDDLVDDRSVTETDTDQMGKTLRKWELSLNLGTHLSNRQWIIGTRYSYADLYGVIIERKTAVERLYPATHDGTLTGRPVFLTEARWAEVKRDQRKTIAAQMLQNPLAGEENTFDMKWLRPYEVRPAILNVYILVDPSLGKNKKSDRTAMIVLGVDPNMNFYLIDGYCHRMKLSQRKQHLFELQDKWSKMPGIRSVDVGYERYGVQADIEHMEIEMQRSPERSFAIQEVNWVNEGPQAKTARIGRIEPDFRNSKFWMPPYAWVSGKDSSGRPIGKCTWRIVEDEELVFDQYGRPVIDKNTGEQARRIVEGSAKIRYTPYVGKSTLEREMIREREPYRVMEPLRRRDADGNVYDLFRMFVEEFRLHPFAPHDDVLDATSRVWDMDPVPPAQIEMFDESRAVAYPD